MASFRVTFKVTGSGSFPNDMLRYDNCYPTDPGSVEALGSVGFDDFRKPRAAHLALTINTTATHMKRLIEDHHLPTVSRWASFGWQVSDVKSAKQNSL